MSAEVAIVGGKVFWSIISGAFLALLGTLGAMIKVLIGNYDKNITKRISQNEEDVRDIKENYITDDQVRLILKEHQQQQDRTNSRMITMLDGITKAVDDIKLYNAENEGYKKAMREKDGMGAS